MKKTNKLSQLQIGESKVGPARRAVRSNVAVSAKPPYLRQLRNCLKVKCNFEREPLAGLFGFKGGYLSELWQSAVSLENSSGEYGLGIGTQSVLWSDSEIFSEYPEAVGNSMMFMTSAYAAKKAGKIGWNTPLELNDALLPIVYEYAKKITANPNLRLTFALNAMVAVDNAAWMLYCRENSIKSFDEMVPQEFKSALSGHHDKLSCIPLISYKVPVSDIAKSIDQGFGLLKIKIGSDPEGDGDLEKMLEWDKRRLTEIHQAAKDRNTPHTENGRIPYYLDANGRYDSKDRLMRFLDHAEKIGALDRIILLEEPFPEEMEFNVTDIPVRLAADESAHSDKDALARIEMGYGAIALKPIAKTMSMSLKIAKLAKDKNIPCFCADLTVNPILVDWNKNVAARLSPLPGMKIGVLESNGHQNYRNWETMKSYHPCSGSPWTEIKDGIFHLGEDFYRKSGGILEDSRHYSELVK
jgi:L-alanine-DL-glutamate epimerase-like enolase superfamily enzyme